MVFIQIELKKGEEIICILKVHLQIFSYLTHISYVSKLFWKEGKITY